MGASFGGSCLDFGSGNIGGERIDVCTLLDAPAELKLSPGLLTCREGDVLQLTLGVGDLKESVRLALRYFNPTVDLPSQEVVHMFSSITVRIEDSD